MPGLILFNRRWGLGSDDLVYPGLAEIFIRFVWLVAISIVFHIHQEVTSQCHGGELLQAYYIGLLTLLSVTIVLTVVTVYTSMQGTITNSYPRKRITKLLYIKIGISFPELIWNCMGTYWSFGSSSGCETNVVRTVQGAVISGWLLVLILVVGLVVVFDPLGGKSNRMRTQSQLAGLESSTREQFLISARAASKKTWERRCKFLCFCVACDDQNKDAFSDIAILLTDFFQGVDLVVTDIVAGLFLVQREQDILAGRLTSVITEDGHGDQLAGSGYETFSSILNSSERNRPSQTNNAALQVGQPLPEPKPWMNTTLMAHYMKFAAASYGWPLYVFGNLATGLCMLCGQCSCLCPSCNREKCFKKTRHAVRNLSDLDKCDIIACDYQQVINDADMSVHKCCSCLRPQQQVYEDNCCQCNTSAIKRWTELNNDDLLYASFHNEIYEIPFFVAIDRKEQAVVVSVRGTLSLRDALTDMTADCDCIGLEEEEDFLAHRGILQAARYVKSELENLHLLEKAFEEVQGAKLVITGHSLGAGAAALLSILLKPTYPDLICFAFSPPGGLLSLSASVSCKDYICSVVLGKDLVPRLGIRSLEFLKTKTLQAIRNCKYPKYRILATGVFQQFCGACGSDTGSVNTDQPLLSEGTKSSYVNGQRNVEEAIQDAIHQSEQCRITYPTLYPPGQVLHIMEVDTDRGCCGKPSYYAEWKSLTDFQEIIVSPEMLSDHLPDIVLKAIEQLAAKNFTPRSRARSQETQGVASV